MLLNNRWTQVALILPLLVCSADFVNRYDVTSDERASKAFEPLPAGSSYSPLTQKTYEDIVSGFADYDRPVEKVTSKKKPVKEKPNPNLSKEFQNAQNGKLDRVFIGDYSYRPLGVFSEHSHFALLERRHLKNGKVKRIKVVELQKIANYQVTKIELNQITIVAEQRTIVLKLFKTQTKAKR